MFPPSDTRAYSKARQRLPEQVWAELVRRTGRDLLFEAPGRWCWRGRDVKIVDGTTLSMPDTPTNQAAYSQFASQKPGLGFPVLRLVALFSLAVGSVLDVAMGPRKGKHTGETSLFRTLHHHLHDGDVVLADRYFSGWFDLALLGQRGVQSVVRKHQLRATDFRTGRRLDHNDHLVCWTKPQRPAWMSQEHYAALPDSLTLREVRVLVEHKGFRTREVIVVTTLLDAQNYSAAEIAKLYRRRWQAELHLRSLKIACKWTTCAARRRTEFAMNSICTWWPII